MTNAITTCMSGSGPSATTLTTKIDAYSKSGEIDNVTNLKNHRVYVYSGTKDTVVKPGNTKIILLKIRISISIAHVLFVLEQKKT